MIFDPEEKITEFNYENFIPKHLLATMDTDSSDFKRMIKQMNLTSPTQYEKHQQQQETFKQIMPILSHLDA